MNKNNNKKKRNIEFVFLRKPKKIKNISQDKQNFILNQKNPFIKENKNNFLIDKTLYKEKANKRVRKKIK